MNQIMHNSNVRCTHQNQQNYFVGNRQNCRRIEKGWLEKVGQCI